jgi:hypothetical protein
MPTKPKPAPRSKPITVAAIISDLHCGCQYGLCPPRVTLDGGGIYRHSEWQALVWTWWLHYWRVWLPRVLREAGTPRWALVINGDSIDGRHHGSTTQVSQNLADQHKIAIESMKYAFDKIHPAAIYVIRGTEVHVGQSGEMEEQLAHDLGARPTSTGQYARQALWLQVGSGLAHILHHIGTCGSQSYEGTALSKEYTESCTESARWGYPAPDWVVRSHRHRNYECRLPSRNGRATVLVTPAWQLKTPFAYRIAGARQSESQIGGCAIIAGSDEFYTRSYVQSLPREKPEVA